MERDMIEVYNLESRRGIPAAVLEKDILLTDVLQAISEIRPRGSPSHLQSGIDSAYETPDVRIFTGFISRR